MSASSATSSFASKLILENIDLPSTLNVTLQNYFEVRSLSLFNRNYLTPLANRIMQFKTFVNAVALALFAASVHAKVPAGTYSIINKVLSSGDDSRAITFNGEGQTVTVSSNNPTDLAQVEFGSINHPVYLCLTHPSAVDCGRLRRPENPKHFSLRR